MTADAVTGGAGGAVRTTCPYCGVGCGVLARPLPDGSVEISGDPDHPANFGRLCSKGAALGETLSLDDRLLTPKIGGTDTDWNSALGLVARTFSRTIAEHGPDSVAFYVSGQLLTEDYYIANKLMKGFIGSANIDTNSRLCMASTVAGHRRAFGSDTVPGTYEDLELADLVVLVGSNLAWCHPVLYQRLVAAKEEHGTKVVVVDPRRTATAEIADLHLALAPGSDIALFNGLLDHLDRTGALDEDYVDAHTEGFSDAMATARESGFDGAVTATELPAETLSRFYALFDENRKVVTVFSQGVNQSQVGTDKVNAIINCHLATGRIGQPGMGPFSVTGQPNAMGGREVGGLANMLAAHMAIENPEHRRIVQTFWQSPMIAEKSGLKAVDLFRAVGDRRIKALWIMATNPAVSMPQADTVVEALRTCPFVVVSDVTAETDTAQHADVLLPATAWGEKDGTVTNSERRMSRQRAFLPPVGDARPDWWIISRVAKLMGFGGFDYGGPADIFREHAALTAIANNGSRSLDLGGLAGLDNAGYAAFEPTQWPVPVAAKSPSGGRLLSDGKFNTPDGRARFIATHASQGEPRSSAGPDLILNTGRIRDQWHTMTRTAKAPRLMTHIAEPFVEMHPADAERHGLAPASLARVESEHGTMIGRVMITEQQRPGSVFAPMHWTSRLSSKGRIDAVVTGDPDPVSGQPQLKLTPVSVKPLGETWYGFAVLREKPARIAADYWSMAQARGGWRVEMAGVTEPGDWTNWARDLLAIEDDTDLLAVHDDGARRHRFAAFSGDTLRAALFIEAQPVSISRGFTSDGLTGDFPSPSDRLRLLAGRPGADTPDPGAIVCSCFEVGANQIIEAIVGRNCLTVEAIGASLSAGTNCGSCRPDIQRIIHERTVQEAV
jgi:assimilatory nitrate reductase catalytic subunit